MHSKSAASLILLSLFGTSRATYILPRASPVGSTVKLDYGTFHGLEDHTTGILYFRGVRFADPPVGNLRWRAPVSPPSTQLGDVKATQFANACISATQRRVTSGTSEDCLFGNVYVPINTAVSDGLPVMVWFHGGGFQSGSTHDAPPELILHSSSNPMIFISFEYRLGPLGFLGGTQINDDGDLNVGLLDQRAALRWVQRYIGQFGGDNKKVTIWGQSAGAGSTMFHLIANGGDNEGLFRAAMGDSPSLSFVPAFNEDYDVQIFNQYASFAGCGNQGANVLSCLRSADANTLASASSQVLAARPSTLFVFAPILDGKFINERPVEAYAAGHFARVPVVFGSNTNEGAHWSAELRDPSANTSMPNATEDTVFNFIRGQYVTFTQASVNRGFELYPLNSFNGSFSLQGQQMYGEVRYICTAGMITGSVSKFTTAYQYHYDNPHLGSFHADELDAFFSPPANADQNDLALFEAMREYYTSFVTTGTPSAENAVAWDRVSSPSGSSRILFHPGGIKMEVVDDVLNTRCNFWHGINQEMET
ncbi:alpha/beta-hydrolase [Macrolepiota fuliginosa MF-IS2]|uniref:Carboxylic ester hydrolase n=1 Tax=Macrolepiota fuliginosa MF-IS2 TaxID=1400762 RepID=A0A9P6BY46_9AGAR|nr:alpha/beta-hydrolase [Macrolepiota fuliginosa MF-IS2]